MYTSLAFLTGENFPVYGTTHPVHVLEKETVYMKNNMDKIHCSYEIKKLKKQKLLVLLLFIYEKFIDT